MSLAIYVTAEKYEFFNEFGTKLGELPKGLVCFLGEDGILFANYKDWHVILAFNQVEVEYSGRESFND